MRADGLRVTSALGDVEVKSVQATDDPAEIGPVDAVFVAVKLYDMESVAEACRPLIGPDTMLVSFQNGVTAPEMLAARLGRPHIIGGVTYILSVIERPGLVAHLGPFARLLFGEFGGAPSPRVDALKAVCDRAGIEAAISADIEVDIWTKFAILAPLSGMTSLHDRLLGAIRAHADQWAMFEAAVEEVIAVARARGVALPDDARADIMGRIAALPEDMGSSMMHDLAHGKPLELDWLSGAVVKLGAELGVATPAHQTVLDALGPYSHGNI